MFKQLSGITLQQASQSRSGPSQHPLKVCGQFTATLSQGATEVEEEIYVVQGLETALVGRPAIEAMGLISRVNTVKGYKEYVEKYPARSRLNGRSLPLHAPTRCRTVCSHHLIF